MAKIKSFKRNLGNLRRVQMALLSCDRCFKYSARATFVRCVPGANCVKFHFFSFEKQRTKNPLSSFILIIYTCYYFSILLLLLYIMIFTLVYARLCVCAIISFVYALHGHPGPQSFKSPRQVVRSFPPPVAACCQFHSPPGAPHRRRRRLQ